MDYERSLKIKWDNYATMQSMHDEGLQKGFKKGKHEGIQEGIKKGIQEGMQKGMQEAAQEMKRLGLPLNSIVQVTKLSIEEIEKL